MTEPQSHPRCEWCIANRKPESKDTEASANYIPKKRAVIAFPGVTFEWEPEHRRCVTTFADGTQCYACPHETPEYHAHATEKANGNIDAYAFSHDVSHHIVSLMAGRKYSIVLYSLAHDLPVDTEECQREEDEAQAFQRAFFLRYPLIHELQCSDSLP
jgi:hypothetical protein